MAGRGRGRRTIKSDDSQERVYDINLSLAQGQECGAYKEDVLKSLDQVAEERGVLQPPSMAGRGRGRRTIKSDDSQERVYDINLSLDDLIKGTVSYNRELKGTLGACSTQGQECGTYKEDVFKSLDQVAEERGILQPPSKCNSKYDNDNLPITGKHAKTTQRFATSFSVETAVLDPMDNSLDTIISNLRNNKGDVAGSSKQSKLGEDDTEGIFRMKIDPMANSLDDVIMDRHIGNGAGYSKKRSRNDASGMDKMEVDFGGHDRSKQIRLNFTPKYTPTPYKAVSFLQNKGMILDFKIGLKAAATKEDKDPVRKWRCIVACGSVQGVADSARKTVARELACDEFIKNLKKNYPDCKIPRYEVPDELLLNPKVYAEIEKLCDQSGTTVWHEFKFGNMEDEYGTTEFTCVYYVGEEEIMEKSCDKKYAQLKAAVKVYEILKGEPFPKSVYFTNDECDLNVEYEFTESEVYQVAYPVSKLTEN